jgi:hypothetical protein
MTDHDIAAIVGKLVTVNVFYIHPALDTSDADDNLHDTYTEHVFFLLKINNPSVRHPVWPYLALFGPPFGPPSGPIWLHLAPSGPPSSPVWPSIWPHLASSSPPSSPLFGSSVWHLSMALPSGTSVWPSLASLKGINLLKFA